MPKFESNKTPPCQLIQRRSEAEQHDHLIWIKTRFFALFGGVERGERQVRWKKRGFERFTGGVCSEEEVWSDHTTKGRGMSVIFLLIKSECEFEPDVRSRHASLQVNEWQIRPPLSARLMTRLHDTTEPNLPWLHLRRAEACWNFCTDVIGTQCSLTLPSGAHWSHAKLQLVWKHCGQS